MSDRSLHALWWERTQLLLQVMALLPRHAEPSPTPPPSITGEASDWLVAYR